MVKHMKTGIFFPTLFTLLFLIPATAEARKKPYDKEALRNEILQMLKNRDLSFLPNAVEEVDIDFLINARNEIVILDVFGESCEACEFVKGVLNYRRVKYSEARQLTRYMLRVKLVKK